MNKTRAQPGMTFGKQNRPSTPVGGIIQNTYGEGAAQTLQDRYIQFQNHQKNQGKGGIAIRYTAAQIHADNAVRSKNQMAEPKPDFKLKRFQNINPRTSTKRGDQAYMVSVRENRGAANATAQPASTTDVGADQQL